jgi:hypothetical protein
MSKKRLFENYAKPDRIQALRDNAERVEDFSYFREYEPEELDVLKDEYFQDAGELQNHENILKAAKDEFKTNAGPIKEKMKESFNGIRNKGRTVTEKVFLLADHESSMMEYYNEAGELIHGRRLLADEKQLRIPMTKNGTNL